MKAVLLLPLTVCAIGIIGCGQSFEPESSHLELAGSPGGIAPVQLTDANFQQKVRQSDMPVLVDIWAPWCQHCAAMKPTIRELAEDLQGKAIVGELNIEENPFIQQKYDIDKYPMLLIFVDGKEVGRIVGNSTLDELWAAVSAHTDIQAIGNERAEHEAVPH